jgi:predicted glycosyltransferase
MDRVALLREENVSEATLLAALKEAVCGLSQLAGKLNLNSVRKVANHLKTRIPSEEWI